MNKTYFEGTVRDLLSALTAVEPLIELINVTAEVDTNSTIVKATLYFNNKRYTSPADRNDL